MKPRTTHRIIHLTAKRHPDWSVTRIARVLQMKPAAVRRALEFGPGVSTAVVQQRIAKRALKARPPVDVSVGNIRRIRVRPKRHEDWLVRWGA